MSKDFSIAVIGCGRMGRGICEAYAFAGYNALMIDLKERSTEDRETLKKDALAEIRDDLTFLANLGIGHPSKVDTVLARIKAVDAAAAQSHLSGLSILYEGVPETLDAKKSAFDWACQYASPTTVMASTSSTMAVRDLAKFGTNPERFVNAHWLNPAMLMPLVEVARGQDSSDAAVDALVASLDAVGKKPVVMKSSPGYIVPRLQALAMTEAVRIAEEGVASVEDVDKAIRLGFGIRYAILGVIEFIDFGGNDILHHATNYLSANLDEERFKAPASVGENMKSGRNGMRDGAGYYNWDGVDTAAYRAGQLAAFTKLLGFLELLPSPAASDK